MHIMATGGPFGLIANGPQDQNLLPLIAADITRPAPESFVHPTFAERMSRLGVDGRDGDDERDALRVIADTNRTRPL